MRIYKLLTTLLVVFFLSVNLYAIDCPDSFEGIKNLSRKKRLECTLFRIAIIERYLDEEQGFEWKEDQKEIASLVKRIQGMEQKVRGRYESFCSESFLKDKKNFQKCIENFKNEFH